VLGSDNLPGDLKAARALLALKCASCGGLYNELMEGLEGLA